MSTLYNRQVRVTAGRLVVSSLHEGVSAQIHNTLRVAFSVDQNEQKDPDKAEVSIWNLSEDSRHVLHTGKALQTIIEAGYSGRGLLHTIFVGDLTYAQSQRQGPDWVTKLQAADGATQFSAARINDYVTKGARAVDVALKAALAMGLPLGNLQAALAGGSARGGNALLQKAQVLSGKAEQEFSKIMKKLGFGWRIRNGQIEASRPGEILGTDKAILNFQSGLIGAPEKGEKGKVKARSLIQPGLVPARRVILDTLDDSLAGEYRIERAVYKGDTWADDWYVDLELSPAGAGAASG